MAVYMNMCYPALGTYLMCISPKVLFRKTTCSAVQWGNTVLNTCMRSVDNVRLPVNSHIRLLREYSLSNGLRCHPSNGQLATQRGHVQISVLGQTEVGYLEYLSICNQHIPAGQVSVHHWQGSQELLQTVCGVRWTSDTLILWSSWNYKLIHKGRTCVS